MPITRVFLIQSISDTSKASICPCPVSTCPKVYAILISIIITQFFLFLNLHKWNHMNFFCVWLLLLSIMPSANDIAWVVHLFLAAWYPTLWIFHIIFVLSLTDEHLRVSSLELLWIIWDSMNSLIYLFWWAGQLYRVELLNHKVGLVVTIKFSKVVEPNLHSQHILGNT